MKIIKKIIWVFLVLLLIPLILALFISKDYKVEKEIMINKPKNEVFSYIKLLKNQNNYSKWANMDAKMEKTYSGIDGTIGFVSAWKSKKEDVGVGEQEIIGITEGEKVDYELRFKEPFESVSKAYMVTEELSANKTKVTWGFLGHMNYPMNLLLLLMDFKKMIGDDLTIGLTNLKKVLEQP